MWLLSTTKAGLLGGWPFLLPRVSSFAVGVGGFLLGVVDGCASVWKGWQI